MLAQHVRHNTARANLRLLSQYTSQPCRIQTRARANDLRFWQTRQFAREIGQDVDGVCDEKKDSVWIDRRHGAED